MPIGISHNTYLETPVWLLTQYQRKESDHVAIYFLIEIVFTSQFLIEKRQLGFAYFRKRKFAFIYFQFEVSVGSMK